MAAQVSKLEDDQGTLLNAVEGDAVAAGWQIFQINGLDALFIGECTPLELGNSGTVGSARLGEEEQGLESIVRLLDQVVTLPEHRHHSVAGSFVSITWQPYEVL